LSESRGGGNIRILEKKEGGKRCPCRREKKSLLMLGTRKRKKRRGQFNQGKERRWERKKGSLVSSEKKDSVESGRGEIKFCELRKKGEKR